MTQDIGTLVVELYLEGARVIGICRQVHERRRLIDVLNTPDSVLELEGAEVFLAGSRQQEHYPTLTVIKQTLIAAVPCETEEQNRMRAVLANVVGKQVTIRQQASLLVPPLSIRGEAHMPMGAGATVNMTERLSRFFPVTSATVTAMNEASRELGVILVSREHVVGTSIAPAPRHATAI